MSHLILYDDSCPVCNQLIYLILKQDKRKQFLYSSLEGNTASSFSDTFSFPEPKSVVLIENYGTQEQQVYFKGKAVFKIFWHLGGIWKIFGWKYIFPSVCTNWLYDLFARKRDKMCKKCHLQHPHLDKDERFLP